MVRLNTKRANLTLLAIMLVVAAWPARAQSATPQAAPQQQTPPPSTGPMHWRAQGNTVQPVTQPAQQIQGVPSAQSSTQPPVQQATPGYTTGTAAPAIAKPAVTPTAHRRSGRASKTQVAEVPPPLPPPPTLDQQPPTPPQVRYQNGQLTINAQNSTLSQVLRAVQAQTGASIDIPGM